MKSEMNKMMKAAVFKEDGIINIEEIPRPKINDDNMLIRVEACSICGSDLRIYSKKDAKAKFPVVLGHEIAGTVEIVGKNVKNFEVGDNVCIAPGFGCGKCSYCQNGNENVCINPYPPFGYAYNGGFAQYFAPPSFVIKNDFVNKIPETISFEEASLIEPLACCINGQQNTKVKKSDSVLIFGAGPIGCIHLQLSKINGAAKVFLVDINSERLNIAKKFSPYRSINSSKENLKEIIMKETNNEGVNVIFICAPSKEAQIESLKLLAPKGKINFFAGLPKDDSIINIDANQIHYRELIITGSSSSLAKGNKEAIKLISEKIINLKEFITHTLPLDKINYGFQLMKEKSCLKVTIKPWE